MAGTKKSAGAQSVETDVEQRETVFKGFYIYRDQYTKLIELTAHNKIKGIEPSSQSEILRAALDLYFNK